MTAVRVSISAMCKSVAHRWIGFQRRALWGEREKPAGGLVVINLSATAICAGRKGSVLRRRLRRLCFYRRMVIVVSVLRAPAPPRPLPMQHFLNFLAEPHGQGSFRPTDGWEALSAATERALFLAWA